MDNELTLEDFTDTFAQMLVYGLFMARLNSAADKIDLYNVKKYIPGAFDLIRELVGFLDVLNEENYSETRWIVEEVLNILNSMDIRAIHEVLSFTRRQKDKTDETAKDPYIYFYEDFLKTDFPRIPFTDSYDIFQSMSGLGWELIRAHLQKVKTELDKSYKGLGDFAVQGDNLVEKVRYDENRQRLYINGEQYFGDVPDEVYRFYIGGYQVMSKYLKDRKGRALTLDEINNKRGFRVA